MNREDAFYYKNLLMLGFSDGYDEWLNGYLEAENPLSNIVLELSCCGSDVEKSISILHSYCAEQPFDKSVSCDRLRRFFKDAYYASKMSKEEISSAFYTLSIHLGAPDGADADLWEGMYILDDYYALAKEGILSWEKFDLAFFSYLDNGIHMNPDQIWSEYTEARPSLWERIRTVFKRK